MLPNINSVSLGERYIGAHWINFYLFYRLDIFQSTFFKMDTICCNLLSPEAYSLLVSSLWMAMTEKCYLGMLQHGVPTFRPGVSAAVLATPLPIQPPSHTPGKAAEDGPSNLLPCGRAEWSFWLLVSAHPTFHCHGHLMSKLTDGRVHSLSFCLSSSKINKP